MSDISAVVLTMGEPGTAAALASLRSQTVPPREIVVVRGVSPFHQALNTGAGQVTTRFFVQVDGDMILDPCCLAELRGLVRRNSGIVVGQLRDALIGRVVGVKLFRTAPFRKVLMGDTISPDTDLGRALQRTGWQTVYAGRPPERDPDAWRTYGEHRPDYGPEYTYRKYVLEGRRYRYRDNPEGIRWHFGRLEASAHGSATIAQIALAHGIFLESERDLLGRLQPDDEFARVASFLARSGTAPPDDSAGPDPGASAAESFGRFHQLGRELAARGESGQFRRILGGLRGCHRNEAALVAKIGLGRGVMTPNADTTQMIADFAVVQAFLAARPVLVDGGLRGAAVRVRRWLLP